MTQEDKFVELVMRSSDTGQSAYTQAGMSANEEDVRNYYNNINNTYSARVIVKGESFIIAYIHPYELNLDILTCVIAHFVSFDGHGHKLLAEIEQWATDAGCRIIVQPTLYNNDARLVKYYEKRGYKHSGFTFTKEV